MYPFQLSVAHRSMNETQSHRLLLNMANVRGSHKIKTMIYFQYQRYIRMYDTTK